MTIAVGMTVAALVLTACGFYWDRGRVWSVDVGEDARTPAAERTVSIVRFNNRSHRIVLTIDRFELSQRTDRFLGPQTHYQFPGIPEGLGPITAKDHRVDIPIPLLVDLFDTTRKVTVRIQPTTWGRRFARVTTKAVIEGCALDRTGMVTTVEAYEDMKGRRFPISEERLALQHATTWANANHLDSASVLQWCRQFAEYRVRWLEPQTSPAADFDPASTSDSIQVRKVDVIQITAVAGSAIRSLAPRFFAWVEATPEQSAMRAKWWASRRYLLCEFQKNLKIAS